MIHLDPAEGLCSVLKENEEVILILMNLQWRELRCHGYIGGGTVICANEGCTTCHEVLREWRRELLEVVF